jgi:hypothetical protein
MTANPSDIEDPTPLAAAVSALLVRAGLVLSSAELAILIDHYPTFKERMNSLYTIPGARYEVPGLVFDPAPNFADWTEPTRQAGTAGDQARTAGGQPQ